MGLVLIVGFLLLVPLCLRGESPLRALRDSVVSFFRNAR
jgi:hypothetical protein